MSEVSNRRSEPELVTVSPWAKSERRGHEALVVELKVRSRTRTRSEPRYDYLLRFEDGWTAWFGPEEVIR